MYGLVGVCDCSGPRWNALALFLFKFSVFNDLYRRLDRDAILSSRPVENRTPWPSYQGRLCTITALHGGKSTSRVTGFASMGLHFPVASTGVPPSVISTLLSGEGAAR
jgi:hypothetical protein